MNLDNARNAKAEIFERAFGLQAAAAPAQGEPELASTAGSLLSALKKLPRSIGQNGGTSDGSDQFGSTSAGGNDGRLLGGLSAGEGSNYAGSLDTGEDIGVNWPAAISKVIPRTNPLPIAIGLQLTASASTARLVLIAEDASLRNHPAVEQAIHIARGEASFVVASEARALSCWQPARRRPLALGLSIGHRSSTAGTLGCCVKLSDGTVCILSNNHVLANVNQAAVGDQVLQPGRTDGGQVDADAIATLLKFVPIVADSVGVNLVDCAVALLGASVDPTNLFVDDALGPVPPLRGLATTDLLYADPVWKVGRTTGLTNGKVFAVEVDNYLVNMGTPLDPFRCRFNGQIQVYADDRGFAAEGDSGSLVLDHDGFAHGLLFAGSASGGPTGTGLAIVNPLEVVLKQLDATLWMG